MSVFKERKEPMEEKNERALSEEKVVEIEVERLKSFENHPFKVRADSQMVVALFFMFRRNNISFSTHKVRA